MIMIKKKSFGGKRKVGKDRKSINDDNNIQMSKCLFEVRVK